MQLSVEQCNEKEKFIANSGLIIIICINNTAKFMSFKNFILSKKMLETKNT